MCRAEDREVHLLAASDAFQNVSDHKYREGARCKLQLVKRQFYSGGEGRGLTHPRWRLPYS